MIPYHEFKGSPTIPELYYNAVSNEQRIKNICIEIKKLIKYSELFGKELNDLTALYNQIEAIYEGIKNGEYVDLYIDSLEKYLNEYILAYFYESAKYVYPTLEWDGNAYRVAMIVPNRWDYLKFKWLYDEKDTTYHMALEFDSEHVQPYRHDFDRMKHEFIKMKDEIKELKAEVNSNA